MYKPYFRRTPLATGIAVALGATIATPVAAQYDDGEEVIEEIVTTGIRASLIGSVNTKRYSESIVDGISSEDIGKLPDVTIADSLQRIPGIQIQRDAGEGATVNIRGLPQIRTLLNGEQFLTAGNIGEAQPRLTDIPSQLVKGVDVYKSANLKNKRNGLTGTIDLKTWRPLDFDEGISTSFAAEYARGKDTAEDDHNVNGLINWNNGTVGVMVSAATSEANLGNNFAGYSGGVFPSNDWGGYAAGTDLWLAPHGFDSFNRAVERQRDAVNAAFQADFGDGFRFTAETFFTEMDQFDRKVGLNISNRWSTLNYLTPTAFTNTGVVNHWSGGEWLAVNEYDVDALWVNSFTVNRTNTSKAEHYNLELEYARDNWSVRARYINDQAELLSMNGQSQGDLSNWDGTQAYKPPGWGGNYPFYPANIASQYDPGRLSAEVGDNGGRFIEPNPMGYGEDPQLSVNLGGSHPVWTGFDSPLAGPLGPGATLADYMANVNSYAIGAFSSEGNQFNDAANDIFSLDGQYSFDAPLGGFITEVRAGARSSGRDAFIRNFHLFSDFYAGNGAQDPNGCAAQWKAIDVVMENPQCQAGEMLNGQMQFYTVNRPTRLDEFNNVVFVTDFGGVTSGIPGVWAADPRDYDNVTAFHERVFGGANRVRRPGQSYDVSLDENSYFIDASFDFEDINLSGTLGLRYIDTEISTRQNLVGEVQAYGDTNLDVGDEFSTNDFSDTLPALNLAWRPTDNWTVRFSYSKNMMAHDLGTYGGGLTIFTVACTDPSIVGGRCVSGAEEGGNPFIDPWRTDNYDLSVEYYLGRATMFNIAVFRVDVESFTSSGVRRDSFPDSDGVVRREVDVTTVILGEGGEIEGLELGARVDFSDFTDGFWANFGVDANWTHAPSDSNTLGPTGDKVPFPDNSKNQYNLVGWFQNEKWQARLAYNWRSERYTGTQATLLGFQDSIGYLDAQVTYYVNDNVSVYANGSNITGEIEDYYIDFGQGSTQYWQQNEFEPRYTIGLRARF